MNRKQVFAFAAAAIVLTLAGATGGYWIAIRPNPQTVETKPDTNAMGQGKAMYWYDPMVPAQHFDKPGKSPFMDMHWYLNMLMRAASATVFVSTRYLLRIRG